MLPVPKSDEVVAKPWPGLVRLANSLRAVCNSAAATGDAVGGRIIDLPQQDAAAASTSRAR